jgi:hypothetical protein
MSLVRIFVAWLIFAALPLQGFAAASMVLCEHSGGAAVAANERHTMHAHEDHRADEPVHHAEPAAPDAHHAQLELGIDPASTAQSPHDHSDACQHACSVCASCHVMGLDRSNEPAAAPELVSAVLPQSVQPLLTRAPPRPDKPPRA